MMDRDNERLGVLIQSYIRAQRREDGTGALVAREALPLDADIRDRVDALGIDSDRLLVVGAADVLDELQVLEREAALEDARVGSTAGRGRAPEERHIHGDTSVRPRASRMSSGRHREPAGRGRRRQRGPR